MTLTKSHLEAGRILERGPPERIVSEPARAQTRRFLTRLREGEGF